MDYEKAAFAILRLKRWFGIIFHYRKKLKDAEALVNQSRYCAVTFVLRYTKKVCDFPEREWCAFFTLLSVNSGGTILWHVFLFRLQRQLSRQ